MVVAGASFDAFVSNGLNDLSASEVNAEVDTALADYDAPTKAELDLGLAGLNDISTSDVTNAITGELGSIAEAVWDEALSGHTTAGTTGKALSDTESAAGSTLSAVNGLNDLSSAEVTTACTSALNSYDPPTKAELDSGLSGITASIDPEDVKTALTAQGYTTTRAAKLDNLDAAVSSIGGAVGAGAVEYTTDEFQDSQGNPLPGVDVWVTTDKAGNHVVAGALQTDVTGKVTFNLDEGDYYLWAQKPGRISSVSALEFSVAAWGGWTSTGDDEDYGDF